jgi:hypothetical protein
LTLALRGRGGGTTSEELEALGEGGRKCLNDLRLNEESGSGGRGELRFMGGFGPGGGFDDAESFVQGKNEGRFSLYGICEVGRIVSFGRDCVESALLGSV